ncbi:MAG: hypothetical protein H6719_05140 [Sandaracinaceae bacterium]|nr:hypothetical protein [Sandaracinaceae bacterium]
MTFQLRSWFNASGLPEDRRLQAQIFFPRAVSTLDSEDMRTLEALVAAYRPRLIGTRAEVLCVGHADWRGTEPYNQDLAFRRSDEVKAFIDRRLSQYRTFSSHAAHSRGERDSVVRAPRDRMAYDRRVDVWSTYVPLLGHYDALPIEVFVPLWVHRITFRVLESASYTNNRPEPGGDDALDTLLDDLTDRLFRSDGETSQFLFGSEDLSRRQTARVLSTARVNAVHIEDYAEYDVGLASEAHISRLEITYTWGRPEPTVLLTRNYTRRYLGGPHPNPPGPERTRIPRARADQHPLIFPPDPESPARRGRTR